MKLLNCNFSDEPKLFSEKLTYILVLPVGNAWFNEIFVNTNFINLNNNLF